MKAINKNKFKYIYRNTFLTMSLVDLHSCKASLFWNLVLFRRMPILSTNYYNVKGVLCGQAERS